VAGWIWRLYHATGDGRLFNYPVHLSRSEQSRLCVTLIFESKQLYLFDCHIFKYENAGIIVNLKAV
jgi:hypothetical protein